MLNIIDHWYDPLSEFFLYTCIAQACFMPEFGHKLHVYYNECLLIECVY